jgi:hypothetical protein
VAFFFYLLCRKSSAFRRCLTLSVPSFDAKSGFNSRSRARDVFSGAATHNNPPPWSSSTSTSRSLPTYLILDDGNGIRDRCCRVDRARRAHMFRLGPVLSAYCRPAAGVAGRTGPSHLFFADIVVCCDQLLLLTQHVYCLPYRFGRRCEKRLCCTCWFRSVLVRCRQCRFGRASPCPCYPGNVPT